MTALDWSGLMRAGLQGLRLKPSEFWALTPAELMLMLGTDAPPRALDRATLETLARQFPDCMEKGGSDGE